jgi:predicted HTH domain antitoxin
MLLIREELLKKEGRTNEELKIDLACWLYDHGALSWGRAAEFCSLDKYRFWAELEKRGSTILDEAGILEEIRKTSMQQ